MTEPLPTVFLCPSVAEHVALPPELQQLMLPYTSYAKNADFRRVAMRIVYETHWISRAKSAPKSERRPRRRPWAIYDAFQSIHIGAYKTLASAMRHAKHHVALRMARYEQPTTAATAAKGRTRD